MRPVEGEVMMLRRAKGKISGTNNSSQYIVDILLNITESEKVV
jgi:hypothetical protein